MTAPRAVRTIHARLRKRYGELEPPRVWDPLEELILTVLSQNTSDTNSGRAFEALRKRFPSWDGLARARAGDVADAIRPGGLANVKAPRILGILREIEERQGDLSLDWMRGASDEDARDYLASLPGVGPKTVACVLAFSLGRAVIPVDTHVHRVAGRLGLLPPKATAEAAHAILAELIPPGLRLEMHVGLIRLGRDLCRAGRPMCADCPLNDICPAAPAFLEAGPAPIRRRGRDE